MNDSAREHDVTFGLTRAAAWLVLIASSLMLVSLGFLVAGIVTVTDERDKAEAALAAKLSEVPAAVIEEGVTAVYFDAEGTEEAKARWAEAGITQTPTCFLIETTDTAHYLCVSDDGMESEHFTS